MEQLRLDVCHRYLNGNLNCTYGNTLVGTLREIYGKNFARGCWDQEKLSQVLVDLDANSLRRLVRDHEAGVLGEHIATVSRQTTFAAF